MGLYVWILLVDINVVVLVVFKEKIVIKVIVVFEKVFYFVNIGWGLNCIRKIIKKEN